MPLYNQAQGDPQSPALIFLHGFLGNHGDWSKTIDYLKDDFYCVCIDLPGHGGSSSISIPLDHGFETTHALIKNVLQDLQIKQYILIGYSLGGRIALDYARTQQDDNLKALVLESCHTGYTSEEQKQARFAYDLDWAKRFATQGVHESLYEWYEQDIFKDLSRAQKDRVIEKRSHNYGVWLANTLLATSLSKQTDALPFLQNNDTGKNTLPVYYCFGKKDTKFKAFSQTFSHLANIQLTEFKESGHNIHQHHPKQYARFIKEHFSK